VALDQYRIGQVQLHQRGASIAKAVQSFRRAIDLDSNFARAHAGLAMALSFAPAYLEEPLFSQIKRSVDEANRALVLDGSLADAYLALGKAHGYAGEWEASDSDIRRAIKLERNSSEAQQTLARHWMLRGYPAKAIEQFERARTVDSTSPILSMWLAYAFFLEGRRDSAIAEIERANQLDTTLVVAANIGALLNLGLGRKDSARKLVSMPVGRGMANAPYVYAMLGDTAMANRLISDMEARNPRPWFVDVARAGVFLATGDTARALTALERSSRDFGAVWVFYIPLGDPAYDPVRKSDRFASLLRQAHIESRVITSPRVEAQARSGR
jgi:serine/threonine-protein kinase